MGQRENTEPTTFDWHAEHKAVSRQQKLIIGLLLLCLTSGSSAVFWASGKFAQFQTVYDAQDKRVAIIEYEMNKGGRYTERRGAMLENRVDRIEGAITNIQKIQSRMDANLTFVVDHLKRHDVR